MEKTTSRCILLLLLNCVRGPNKFLLWSSENDLTMGHNLYSYLLEESRVLEPVYSISIILLSGKYVFIFQCVYFIFKSLK